MNPPSKPPEFRLLVIDDNPAIHDDFRKILLPGTFDSSPLDESEALLFGAAPPTTPLPVYQIDTASQGKEGVDLVRQSVAEGKPYALAFVDMRMPPGWDGLETITRLWEVDPSVQVVLCTAYSDYTWQEMRDRLGSPANLLILKKPFDNIEVLQMACSLAEKWRLDCGARNHLVEIDSMLQQRTAEWRQSEERFAAAFRAAPVPQVIVRLNGGEVADLNDAFLTLTGTTRTQWETACPELLRKTRLSEVLERPQPLAQEAADLLTAGGESRHTFISTQPTTLAGEPHLILMAHDVTGRRELEEQLRHSQKMEAVGQLAAGVAHDFNNILTIIQGHVSLALNTMAMAQELRTPLTETLQASERAATLTRQLLTFSRRQLFRPEPLDLNDLIRGAGTMLQRLLGEQIAAVWELGSDLPPVQGDAPGIEQALVNLTVNARDAMLLGGRLTVSTALADVTAAEAATHPDARAGQYVRLTVKDTGCGIDPANIARIFEPFFTTKELAQGTGMGLATVYGIVRQHEGWLDVQSSPGAGTVFHVYLPVAARTAPAGQTPNQPARPEKVRMSVLLVEDEPAVRSIMKQVLKHCGCEVLEACDARDGYECWSANRDTIELLVTDIVMPGGMNGHDLAHRLLEEKPNLKVIYSSGYSADLFQQGSELVPGQNFLPKPYDCASVATLIRRVASEREETLTFAG